MSQSNYAWAMSHSLPGGGGSSEHYVLGLMILIGASEQENKKETQNETSRHGFDYRDRAKAE